MEGVVPGTGVPESMAVGNLLLWNLQSGQRSAIFLLSGEGMTGKGTEDFRGSRELF